MTSRRRPTTPQHHYVRPTKMAAERGGGLGDSLLGDPHVTAVGPAGWARGGAAVPSCPLPSRGVASPQPAVRQAAASSGLGLSARCSF